jgi:hypothetical protein
MADSVMLAGRGEMPVKHFQLGAPLVPILVWIQFSVVLKMVRPFAGLTIASRCAVVMRGKSIPWLVLTTSKAALALGLLVPIPTCAILTSEQNITKMSVVILFFILYTF